MSQVKGQVIRQRQDRKCQWAAILITNISVADNRLGISSQWYYPWGEVGQFFWAENESHIYPNAKLGCGPTVVSKKRGGGTDR